MKRASDYLIVGAIVLAVPLVPAAFYGFFNAFPVALGLASGHAFLRGTVADTRAAGQVTRLVRHGVIWKTWEATLAVTQAGSPNGPTGWVSYAGTVVFSVLPDDPRSADKVKALDRALRTGAFVHIRLTERLGRIPWLGDSGRYLESIDVAPLPGSRRR